MKTQSNNIKLKTITALLLTLCFFTVDAQPLYKQGSEKYYYAVSIGGIGYYGVKCEDNSEFYMGLAIMQHIALERGWGATSVEQQRRVVSKVVKSDAFKLGANQVHKSGCYKYRQQMQPAVDELWQKIQY